jgi:SWI/SNF-related matrix-associated actin-dependent regulator of chromatin subfamily A3
MGKTLCILALILRTLESAHDWSSIPVSSVHDPPIQQKAKVRTRATLVVASSDCGCIANSLNFRWTNHKLTVMINEWMQEIERYAPMSLACHNSFLINLDISIIRSTAH